MAVYKQCITGVSPIRVSAAYPTYSDGSPHGGIDTVHKDHKAYAPMAGTVVTAHTWQGGTTGNDSWGNYIVVKMSDNSYWLAAHFAKQIHNVGISIHALLAESDSPRTADNTACTPFLSTLSLRRATDL